MKIAREENTCQARVLFSFFRACVAQVRESFRNWGLTLDARAKFKHLLKWSQWRKSFAEGQLFFIIIAFPRSTVL